MHKDLKKILFIIIIWPLAIISNLKAETTDIKEILEIIQKDLRTLERAVYSESFSTSSKSSSTQDTTSQNAEDVLTKHLLKLSEIEKQFQELTNKYEEINFKMDKLYLRLSKVQADNQLRFQNLENKTTINNTENNSLTSLPKTETRQKKVLPGSSQPQDLGTISYKDMTTNSETQVVQSVETTNTISTETFQSEEKILPKGTPKEQYEFATSFLKVGDYNMAERAFREFVDNNPDTFNLLTLRSFGESFYHHITDAALEFGYVGI